ncbi:acyl-CoA carboxylase epsilon subunit [Nocardia transvalensis]|uniref:acyl-CoA carboxylase epsilon subunit n=1 Tax=Nocardia transvalensis TaxID=37333 RepID=UPI0018930141|nr:acyl-CoA carboxylase epsilon subunit [Nocardia transvalensis]MBF6328263.1 hypothetical protein [Nocardia transvalensis]
MRSDQPPDIRVLRGNPDDETLAVLVAVLAAFARTQNLAAARSAARSAEPPVRPSWCRPAGSAPAADWTTRHAPGWADG